MPRTSRRSGTKRVRRKTYWHQEVIDHGLGPSSEQNVNDISHLSISLGNNAGGTCLRMVGNYNYSSVVAGFEQYNYGIGIAVVTKDALTAGVVPDPLTDQEQDWYYWDAWEGILGLENNYTKTFDIHTARKIREGYRLALVLENTTQEVVGQMRIRMRSLWTLE